MDAHTGLTVLHHYGNIEPVRQTHRGIKTTLEIPEKLWERAKRRALAERTSLRALLLEGLELRLSEKTKKGESNER